MILNSKIYTLGAKLAFAIIPILNLHAFEQKIVSLTNEEDKELTELTVELDRHLDLYKFYKDTRDENFKLIMRVPYSLKETQSELGAVFLRSQGHNVVQLFTSNNFNTQNGGHLTLQYLKNGITNKYETIPLEIVRIGDHWKLQNHKMLIKEMRVKSNTLFSKVIGIKTIDIIYE